MGYLYSLFNGEPFGAGVSQPSKSLYKWSKAMFQSHGGTPIAGLGHGQSMDDSG